MERTVICPDCKKILANYTEITVSNISLEISTSKIKLVSDRGGVNRSAITLICPDCGQTVNLDLREIISKLYFHCDWCHNVLPTTEMVDMGQAVICKKCDERISKQASEMADRALERKKNKQ